MKNQTYRMTMLFDFYGEILTDRQKEFFDLYYNEDLSLAEIAENYGISRQGVRDVIVRAEAAMTELEDKTGLIRRFMQMQKKVSVILFSLFLKVLRDLFLTDILSKVDRKSTRLNSSHNVASRMPSSA